MKGIIKMKLNIILKSLFAFILIALFAFSFVACKKNKSNAKSKYEKISSAEAKEIMDNQTGYVILDVRTPFEYEEEHIEGAVLIPDNEISQKAEQVLTDKDQLILVYCRSGRRSKLAADELVKLGYTNIKDFGGIIDWQYETVK